MKTKLKTFSDFVKQLLPHEIAYLRMAGNFKDPVNTGIFNQVVNYNKTGKLKLDDQIDKRKYSYLKNWMTRKLRQVDVDENLRTILNLDARVMTDHVLPADEKQILGLIRSQNRLPFYFMRTYELIRNYQSFLLIRVRHQYHELVSTYLNQNHPAYLRSRDIFEKLNLATRDIISQYSFRVPESVEWEEFLRDVSFDESLDGLNRYDAIVRLTFLYYNYNRLDRIATLYDYLDGQFAKGNFYSRRILLNYYSNRLMLHAKQNESEKAESYGYLSIRDKSSDYIHYLNNLSAVLLRNSKPQRALQLMQEAIPELKKTISYHNRVGFASLFIRALNAVGKPAEGESYASSFFRAYRDKILLYRWHSFFSAWLQSMVMQENYRQVLTVCRRQKIMEREKSYSERPAYLPAISWYYRLSMFKTGEISLPDLKTFIAESSRRFTDKPAIIRLRQELAQHVPELLS